MRALEIEQWALRVLDTLKQQAPVEDSRVELKRSWIEPIKAARRIAGHANALRGKYILWLVGVDELSGVVGADHHEMADWWRQVSVQFDEQIPKLMDFTIQYEELSLVALVFEVDRFPYVVKNPTFGNQGAGPVSLEVPWREGTATRSARRSDIVRLASSSLEEMHFEALKGELTVEPTKEERLLWVLRMTFYATTRSNERRTIPFRKCRCYVQFAGLEESLEFGKIKMKPPMRWVRDSVGDLNFKSESLSMTIEATESEMFALGSGQFLLSAQCITEMYGVGPIVEDSVHVRADLYVVEEATHQSIAIELRSIPRDGKKQLARWMFA